jgi:hypothetical protein
MMSERLFRNARKTDRLRALLGFRETRAKRIACAPFALLRPHIVDLEMEPVWREMRGGIGRHPGPGFVGRASKPAVQEEKELIRAAVYGGWLPKGQAHPYGPVDGNTVRVHMLIDEKIDEAAAGGMGPEIPAEQIAQGAGSRESNFALAYPFQHRISPGPVRKKPEILIGEMQREIQLPLVHGIGRGVLDHVFQIDDRGSTLDEIFPVGILGNAADEERWQFVQASARNFNVRAVHHKTPATSLDARTTALFRI